MWEALVRYWFPGDDFPHDELVRGYYEAKHAVARELQPASILEIGVRAGYSAYAFLNAVPEAEYFGIDAQAPNYGPSLALAEHAREILSPYDARFLCADTQRLTELPASRSGRPWDLVHVDGDHSRQGAEHDIRLAVASWARWILVDDYDDLGAVREAADAVVAGRQDLKVQHIPDPLRGSLVIGRFHSLAWARLASINGGVR